MRYIKYEYNDNGDISIVSDITTKPPNKKIMYEYPNDYIDILIYAKDMRIIDKSKFNNIIEVFLSTHTCSVIQQYIMKEMLKE